MNSENSSSSARRKLSRAFYTRRDALAAARDLLGKRLVVAAPDGSRVAGLIVETEAYMGAEDKASHAYGNRRTGRTESMYAEGGRAYVYFIYGMYYQFNVVVNRREVPHAVLVRAVEPTEGLAWMLRRRPVRRERDLTNGPGKLCAAFGLDRSYDRADLCGERVWIEDARRAFNADEIAAGARIGIDYAEEFAETPWRFWVRDSPFVSRRG
ncbi:MAG TPA: DNA-3-methyladenine glycosylase [Pyrinomonadaceae bacterium]|nr:DNA-3-methyladenine glycosylase [Pyrinomonadaceae bacterium]